ncbi:hypothetical protein BKA62DRAFT_680160 [Auriculariales sp. MPI-PUGE-AT-0066]|nr:hypothetical protein BKA62DRAFT_680160 [Auriculariales sp. MPI-PUGE-AT-0066]
MKRGGSNKQKQKQREHVHTIIEGPWLTRCACDKGIGAQGRMGKYYRSVMVADGSNGILTPARVRKARRARAVREIETGQQSEARPQTKTEMVKREVGTDVRGHGTSGDERDDSLTTTRATRGLQVKGSMRPTKEERDSGKEAMGKARKGKKHNTCLATSIRDDDLRRDLHVAEARRMTKGEGTLLGGQSARHYQPTVRRAQPERCAGRQLRRTQDARRRALKGKGMQALYDEAAETTREGGTPQVQCALLEGHDDQGQKHARSERENPGEDPVRDKTRRGRRSSGMCGSLGANKKMREK